MEKLPKQLMKLNITICNNMFSHLQALSANFIERNHVRLHPLQ